MTRRVLLGLVVVAGLLTAALLPAPAAVTDPVFPEPEPGEAVAGTGASVWYCATGDSDDVRDSEMYIATVPAVRVGITWPSPFGADDADVARQALDAAGAGTIAVSDFLRRGPVPSLIEFDAGPAAAAVSSVIAGEQGLEEISGDGCRAAVSKEWHIAGGTTRDGATLVLRLFNPFPDIAKVALSGASEFGSQPFGDPIDVDGRSFRDVDLSVEARFLDDLSITMTVTEGQVVPALILDEGADRAVWSATGLSRTWDFPFVGTGDLVGSVVVYNPGPGAVTLEIDGLGPDGVESAATTFGLDPLRPLRVLAADISDIATGLRVRSTGPVTAALVVEGLVPADPEAVPVEGEEIELVRDGRLGAVSGVPFPSARWLLPGAGARPSTIHVANTEATPATVTLVALGSSLDPEKVLVPAGSTAAIPVPGSGGGYLVESDLPVSVAWSVESGNAFALFEAVAIDE